MLVDYADYIRQLQRLTFVVQSPQHCCVIDTHVSKQIKCALCVSAEDIKPYTLYG